MTQDNVATRTDGYAEGTEVTLDEALELAKGHHAESNFLLAERTYRDILRAVPDHFPTTQYLGVLLFQTTVFDEALHYLRVAANSQPDDKQCWNNLGATLTELKKYDEALKAYDKALELDSEFVEALNNKSLTLWRAGESEQARKIVEKSLDLQPENLEAQINLGILMSSQGELQEANDLWEKLHKAHPENEKILINWGNTLRDMGRYGKSEQKCRQALELNEDNPEAYNNLGNALRDFGKPEQALEAYNKATDLRPSYHEAHVNKSMALADQGRFQEAAVAARYAVAFKPDSSRAQSALSVALRNMGDYAEARAAAIRAVKADPDSSDPYLDLAEANLTADFLDDAQAAMEEAIKRDPDSARSYKKLAEIREKMGDNVGALKSIDKAIDMEPLMPMLWMSKAQLLQYEKLKEESFEAIDKAIELAPEWHAPLQQKAEMLITVNENEQAVEIAEKAYVLNSNVPGPYATLITLKRIDSADDERFKKFLKIFEQSKKWGLRNCAVMNYALSDAYEMFGDYDKSFEHLKDANDYNKKMLPHDPHANVTYAADLRQRFDTEFLGNLEGKGCESDVPVFIVGMPRSGTTLTEQIISSHPEVHGAGELSYIARIRDELGVISVENAKEFGQMYVDRVKALDPTGKAKRITDKMPGNFMNIGVIVSALPNAKIIHCKRNPIDTCLSCYRQNFASGQYWSYDLEDLANEYNRYLDVMAYWREVLPGRFLEIEYEETVGNLEVQARKLIDYIGLEWDDACLEPHKQKRAILTASKAQVTQPVYKTSVEKWRRYEKHLKPLIDKINVDV